MASDKGTLTVLQERMIRELTGKWDFDLNSTLEIILAGEDFLTFWDGLLSVIPNKTFQAVKDYLCGLTYSEGGKNKKYFGDGTIFKSDGGIISGWFTGTTDQYTFRPEFIPTRRNAMKLCFALKLSADKAKWFLTKVCQQDPFSYRNAEEIIFMYSLKNGLSYGDALRLLKAHDVDLYQRWVENKALYKEHAVLLKKDRGNTQTIISELDGIDDENTLLRELDDIRDVLNGYSHTAYSYYQTIRDELVETIIEYRDKYGAGDMTMIREGYLSKEDILTYIFEDLEADRDARGDKRYPTLKDTYLPKELKNTLIPRLDVYDEIVAGKAEKTTIIPMDRRTLIGLFFAAYFYNLRLNRRLKTENIINLNPEQRHRLENDEFIKYEPEDRLKRFEEIVNQMLADCGMAELYARCKYDFLVLRSVYSEKPIEHLSEIIGMSFNPDIATLFDSFAADYYEMGNYAKALEWYQKAVAIFEKERGKNDPDTIEAYGNIASVYEAMGDTKSAQVWREKANQIST